MSRSALRLENKPAVAEPAAVELNVPDPALFDLARTLEQLMDLRETVPEFSRNIDRMRHPLGSKRVLDLVVSAITLIVFSPLFIAVALAVRMTSPGAAFFSQLRYGLDGRTFKMFKFRTMYFDRADPSGVTQTEEDDPRVTPLGRFLRKTNIDELPQLFNVFLGDMSLVGPRPHVPNMLAGGVPYEQLVPYYFVRQYVRPGLTGLAQLHGLRGPTHDDSVARSRIEHDLAYIERWSLALDLSIIWHTIKAEIRGGRGT